MQVFLAKLRKGNCTGSYSRGLRNQNETCKYVNQTSLLKFKSYFRHIGLENQLEFYTMVKVQGTKLTHHRVIEDGCIWERVPFVNAFAEPVSDNKF